jgi:hypothetical protein
MGTNLAGSEVATRYVQEVPMSADYAATIATQESSPFAAADEQYAAMTTQLRSASALAMTHDALETYLVQQGRELERRMLQAHLDLRAAAEHRIRVKGSDGVERTAARRNTRRRLMSIVGEVAVHRILYQASGVEGLSPQDAALNLPPETYSLGVRQRAAEEAASGSFDHVVEQLAKTTGAPVAKRQVEELVCRAAEDFDEFYAERVPEPEPDDALLVLTFDAAGIPMRPEALRPATRKAREQQHEAERWPPKRLPPGKKRTRKRMAMVTAVYGIPPHPRTVSDIVRELRPLREVGERQKRPRPTNKRVWASVVEDASEVIEQAFAEALLRDPDRRRRWIVLVDGATQQLHDVHKTACELGVDIVIILDVIHVLEYLWNAAHCFHAPGSREAEQWVTKRLTMLLEGTDASDVAAGMCRSATRRGLTKRKAVDDCAKYLRNNRDYLDYATALREGFPIATGVVEGACRFLVRQRLDTAGARWRLDGAEAVLRLRALKASGDFDAYWRYHTAAEHRVNHASRYANQRPPRPIPRPRLRLVK